MMKKIADLKQAKNEMKYVKKEMKHNKNNITELVFILDKSGSMSGLESDTIGGFNSMIEEQKEKDGKCYVTTVLFNHETKILHDRVELESVEALTRSDYRVGGSTALIDAIGETIKLISSIHKYGRKEDVPASTLFVITTDGMENASHIYSDKQVKQMIEKQKKKYGWEFIFIGANIDAVSTAKQYGISEDRAVNYMHDSEGMELMFQGVSKAASCVRMQKPLAPSWSAEINADYQKRK